MFSVGGYKLLDMSRGKQGRLLAVKSKGRIFLSSCPEFFG
jgi:hypothetical protein